MINGLKQLFHRHYRILAIAGVVIFVQVIELSLLERKYDIFTGGFLQPYSYISFTERLRYLAVSTWMDLFMFGSLGLIWFRFSDRMGSRPLLSAYNFFFVCVSVMVVWLAAKFKVLSYFNDTLNFLIIRNLGGGSLREAFLYVAQESAVIVIILVLIMVVYLVLRRLLVRVEYHAGLGAWPEPGTKVWRYLLVGFLFTLMLISLVNADPELRYGMRKKTSFYLLTYTLDPLTDFDRDGHGLLYFPVDGKPFDARVYPGALDLPDNGIDEDGFGGDFSLPDEEPDALSMLMARPGQHILLIVLESARGDMVGKRHGDHLVAPNIMDLVDEGTSIDYAYTHTGYTTSSIKALFNRTLSGRNDRLTLVEYLHDSGYVLSFMSGQDESFGGVAGDVGMDMEGNYFFDARSAIDDRVFPSKEPGSLRLSEERMVRQFRQYTGMADWSQPQFIYVNLQAAHFPYTHPTMPAIINEVPIPRSEINADNRDWLEATYWNAIANADWAIGQMVSQIRLLGEYENTLVVILGDHGESLFDDDFLGHGHALNETQTRIPLIINRPELGVEQSIGQLDVAELIIRLATGQYDPAGWRDTDRGVIQLVGSLQRPQLVGTVRYGGVRATLDLRTRKYLLSGRDQWVDVDSALQDLELGPHALDFLDQWTMLRWQDYRSRRDGE